MAWVAFLPAVLTLGPLDAAAPRPLRVLTSFLPAYCFAVNVAGGLAEVENLAGGSAGPHDVQLSPGTMRQLASADLLVINGVQLESWLPAVLAKLDPARRPVVVELAAGSERQWIRGTSGLTARQDPGTAGRSSPAREEAEAGLAVNPHLWLDPVLALRGVTNILVTLQRADPVHATEYARQAGAFCARLSELDAEFAVTLAPLRDRAFATLHDAFPYLARRYGLRLVGVVEPAPDVQPTPKQLEQLLQTLRTTKTRVIFTEAAHSGRLAAQLARDLGIAIAVLDPLESGPMTSTAYEEGMRRNLQTLRRCLGPSDRR